MRRGRAGREAARLFPCNKGKRHAPPWKRSSSLIHFTKRNEAFANAPRERFSPSPRIGSEDHPLQGVAVCAVIPRFTERGFFGFLLELDSFQEIRGLSFCPLPGKIMNEYSIIAVIHDAEGSG